MFHRMGIILDLPFKNNVTAISIENYQNILEVCSTLVALYNMENPNSQIIILISKNHLIGQLTHLSGDTRHHYQGIWHLIFGNKKISEIDLGFFFTERINIVKNERTKYEIFFISDGSLDFLDSNFFAVFMGKEERRFSVISLGMKYFAIQIMTKITGGRYINLINKQKKALSQIFLKDMQCYGIFISTYYLESSFASNRLIVKKTQNLMKIKKIKICFNCKSDIFSKPQYWCENCGIFLISEQNICANTMIFFRECKLTKNLSFVFNLFIPILNKERKKFKHCANKIFKFFTINTTENIYRLSTKITVNDKSFEHQEILVTIN